MVTLPTLTLEDNRDRQRFAISPAIEGNFGAIAVRIVNIGERGVMVDHAEPLRLAAVGRLTFKFPGSKQPIGLGAVVLWSHLSKVPSESGKYLYESGLRLTEEVDLTGRVVQHLHELSVAYPDRDSMVRKQAMLHAKAQNQPPRMKYLHTQATLVDPDELLLVQHARDQLKIFPDEAIKWYNRARFSVPDSELHSIPHKEDVLAVWEYLERSVSLQKIIAAFSQKR